MYRSTTSQQWLLEAGEEGTEDGLGLGGGAEVAEEDDRNICNVYHFPSFFPLTRRGACDVVISACKQKKMADNGFSPGSSSGEEAPRPPIRYYKRSRGKYYTEDSSDEEESEEERVSRLGSNPLLQTGGSVVGASD